MMEVALLIILSHLLKKERNNEDSVWHEQIFVLDGSGPAFDISSGEIGLGNISVDLITGGWEIDNVDISLFDFGHAEAGLKYDSGEIHVAAFASIYSPSISVSMGDIDIEVGVEIGSIGAGLHKNINSIQGSFGGSIGGSIKLEW